MAERTLDRHSMRQFMDRSRRQRRRNTSRMCIEALEDRLLMASGEADAISVGRTLSAWTVSDVQNNELKINYTVYNQQATIVSDVQLVTTLNSGVGFEDTTGIAQRNGQQITWDLGTLAPLGSASVELTVNLANLAAIQLDSGAQAFGTLNGGSVSDAALPVNLRAGSVDASLLASTPDADWTDPFIQAKAAELDQDAAKIFAFLRDDIGFESYTGSLRGARGTLWSMAGNALDEASLGIALLRASGVPARYVQGTLLDPSASELIASMFPEPQVITGFIDAGTEVSDPANDQALLSEARSHYWIQFDATGAWQDADPAFEDSNIGQTFTTPTGTFTEVPDSLRHKVVVHLQRELATPAVTAFGGGSPLSTSTVLEQEFSTVELVGRPLTFGFFVQTNTLPSPVFSYTTNVYSPYLLVQGDSLDPNGNETIRGTDFTETLTSFPFGTQIVTGLFLDIDVIAPGGTTESYHSTIADRIGTAARANGGSISTSGDPLPILTTSDLTTVNILPSLQSRAAIVQGNAKLERLTTDFTTLMASIAALPDSPERDTRLAAAVPDLTNLLVAASRSRVAQFAAGSDVSTADHATSAVVKAYFDSPRIQVLHVKSHRQDGSPSSLDVTMDLLKNNIRAIAFPGQVPEATFGFRLARGISDTLVEQFTLVPPETGGPVMAVTGVSTIFQSAADQGITTRLITPDTRSQLEILDLSPQAKTLITRALDAGQFVLTPAEMVVINGVSRVAWIELDPQTGESIGVFDDGTHGVFAEWAAMNSASPENNPEVQFNLGVLEGTFSSATLIAIAKFMTWAYISALVPDPSVDAGVYYTLAFKNNLDTLLAAYNLRVSPLFDVLSIEFKLGFAAGLLIAYKYTNDPPVDGLLFGPAPMQELKEIDSQGAPLATKVVFDPLYFVRRGSAEVRSVFRVGIVNATSSVQTYQISLAGVPAGFAGQASVSTITIPAGGTAEVGLALRPVGNIGAPGTDASFRVIVTPVGSPADAVSQVVPFTVPEIHGVELTASPSNPQTYIGTPTTVELTIRSFGNVSQTVHLTANLNAGLTLDGLSDTVIGPGETIVQTLTLSPSPDRPLNSELGLIIQADFGGQLPTSLAIPLRISVPGVDAVADASAAATQLGLPDLGSRLGDLGIALTSLVQAPQNPVLRGQALASLDSVIAQLGADPILAALIDDLVASRGVLESAMTSQQVQVAVTGLGGVLDNLGELLADLAAYRFDLSLVLNSQVAQPQTPVDFAVVIQNTGTETTTYTFAFTNLSADFNGSFSAPSITLAPGEVSTAIVAHITPLSTTESLPTNIVIRATAQEAPAVSRTTTASLTARREFVSVTSVSAAPPFTHPGTTVDITARVLNAVNREQTARATFEIRDAANALIFTSSPVDVSLGVLTTLTTVDLGSFDTTGLALGTYIIAVSLTTTDGVPIPGGTGEGRLLVGSPISASLSTDQDVLPPGTSTVINTLTIESQTSLVGPLGVLSQTDLPGAGGVVHYGQYVYASGSAGIKVFRITDPSNPQLLTTFGSSASTLEIRGDKLYTLTFGGPNGRFSLMIYSIADPENPQFLGTAKYQGSDGIPYGLGWNMVVTDTDVFVSTWSITYLLGGQNDVKYQTGDLIAIDVSDPTAPVFVSALRNTYGTTNDGIGRYLNVDNSGGDGNLWEVVQVDANTLLVAGSTAAGDDTQTGSGVVLVVDISDPAHMTIVRTVVIPGTTAAVGLSIDGNRAFVTGSQGGWSDLSAVQDFTGNTVLAVLDVTDPRNPTILGSQVLNRASAGVTTLRTTPLGNGLFTFSSLGSSQDQPVLYVVDSSDPTNLVMSRTTIPAFTANLDGFGNFLYVTSSSGLIIYQIDAPDAIPVTARVSIPHSGGVSLVPGSFSIDPTQVIAGADFDTYIWNLSLSAGETIRTITWQTTVTGLQSGQTRTIAIDPSVTFTALGTTDDIDLPPLQVVGEQILGLDPGSSSARPGEAASLTLHVSNPTNAPVTYNLAIQGVSSDWLVGLPATVTLGPHAAATLPFSLRSEALAALADYGFAITATTAGGVSGSVQGLLTLVGLPLQPDTEAHGISVQLIPTQSSAGQGARANYIVRLTNTGSGLESYTMALQGLPSNVTAEFLTGPVEISPGVGNFRDILLSLVPQPGATLGNLPFTVSATSIDDSSVSGSANGIVTVLSQGVDVVLSHTASGFQMTVTNTGAATDTFDLILAGPAVRAASLGLNEVTLAAGASQTIPISVGEINFALPGNLDLIGIATSRANSEARDADTTQIVVGAASGLAARFDTDVHVLPIPGTSSFLLIVKNTGNVDDQYTAVITGTTGPVLANLVGLDGLATQAVPKFLLSGLSSGAILLQTNLTAFGQGTVSIQVRSLTDGSLTRTVTATVASPAANVVTTTQITALPNPADFGQQVIVTAIVSAQEGGPPPGSVTFIIDGTPQAPVLIQEINGQARAETTLPSLTAGTHTILASYGGSDPYSASTSALLSLTVKPPAAAAATTTRLTAAPNPATNGEPILLTAIVTSADGRAPTGSVTFIIDGVSRPPVPLSVVDAQAQASLIVGDLAAGGHSITASYGGSAGFALSASDLLLQVAAPPTDRQGPHVVTFQRFGYHARPTTLVLTFNESMDPIYVQDATNYQLVDAHGRSIRITGAVYHPIARTVTLHLGQRLDLNHRFKLTVNGATGDGLRDLQGNLLDGDNDGQIGGNFVTLVDRNALVIDRPTRVPPKHVLALPRKGPASHSFPSPGRPSRLLGLSRSEQSQARRSSTVTQIHPLASQDAPKPMRFIPLAPKRLGTFAEFGRLKGHHMV